jgi:arylsulfatase A-like enzyme
VTPPSTTGQGASRPRLGGPLPIVIALLVGFSVGRWTATGESVPSPSTQPVDAADPSTPGATGARPTTAASASAAQPDIILITIDTLRADHVGAYGHTLATTPWLDQVAAEGVRFDRAISPSSWTVPAMASMLTSLYPEQHQIDRGAVIEGKISRQPALSAQHVTLAEHLKAAGYRTFGVTTNLHLTQELGYAQGFDVFVNEGFRDAEFLSDVVTGWLPDLQGEGPTFLWMHLFDPHDVYQARAPWAAEFHDQMAAQRPAMVADATTRDRRLGRWSRLLMRDLLAAPQTADDPAVVGTLEALYDSEIRYMDDVLGALVQRVDPNGEALLIVTADHGDEFRDHGSLGHRSTLFEELVRVPLIIRAPGSGAAGSRTAGRVVSEPVSTVDVMPTVLDAVVWEGAGGAAGVGPGEGAGSGMDALAEQLSGVSLWPTVQGEGEPVERPLYTSVRRRGERVRAVVVGPDKLIRNEATGVVELYHLPEDPRETRDRSAEQPEVVAALTALLDSGPAGASGVEVPVVEDVQVALEPGVAEELRALGYVDEGGE